MSVIRYRRRRRASGWTGRGSRGWASRWALGGMAAPSRGGVGERALSRYAALSKFMKTSRLRWRHRRPGKHPHEALGDRPVAEDVEVTQGRAAEHHGPKRRGAARDHRVGPRQGAA